MVVKSANKPAKEGVCWAAETEKHLYLYPQKGSNWGVWVGGGRHNVTFIIVVIMRTSCRSLCEPVGAIVVCLK